MRTTTQWKRVLGSAVVAALVLGGASPAAWAGDLHITVIVNAANQAALDDEAIASLFLGQLRSYPGGGGEVVPVNQPSGSNLAQEFASRYLKKTPAQLKAYWAKQVFTGNGRAPKELDGDEAVMGFVAANPGAIGYVESAKLAPGVREARKP